MDHMFFLFVMHRSVSTGTLTGSYWRSDVGVLADVRFLLHRRQVVIRARNLRTNSQFIPAKAFKARKVYYTNEVILLVACNR